MVASGLAFQTYKHQGVLELMAISQADKVTEGFSADAVFKLPSLRLQRKTVAQGVGIVLLVCLLGSYHPSLAAILTSPPSEHEMSAAARLDELARQLEHGRTANDRDQAEDDELAAERGVQSAGDSQDRPERELTRTARAAANAARGGHRGRALRELAALQRDGRETSRQFKALRAALRQIATSLAVRPTRATKAEAAGKSCSPGSWPRKLRCG